MLAIAMAAGDFELEPVVYLPSYWCRRGESNRRRQNRRLGRGWRKRREATSRRA